MPTQTYASAEVDITWNGLDLARGLAEDSFLTIEPLEARNTTTFGADGQMVVSKMANRGATITMTFQQTSQVNKDIANIYAAQDKIGGKIPFAPFTVIDNSGGSAHFVALNAVLTEVATQSFGNTVGEKTWVWVCESYLQAEDPATITAALSDYLNIG